MIYSAPSTVASGELRAAKEKQVGGRTRGDKLLDMYFVFDEQGEPLQISDLEEWTRWCERADRGVARTVVESDVVVLTTFSGIDEVVNGKAPLLFGTRVFGGVLDGEDVQYATRVDALAGHAHLVEWCRLGNSPDWGVTEDQIL